MKRIFHIFALFSILCAVAACTRDEDSLAEITGDSLGIRLDAPAGSGDYSYESLIEDLHVFIFDSVTEEIVPLDLNGKNCYWHFSGNEIQNGLLTLISGNWKRVFEGHAGCDVVAVANLYVESSSGTAFAGDLEDITTAGELEALTDLNTNVADPSSSPFTESAPRLFTMSGSISGWLPEESANVHTLQLSLTRIAAKIEVNITVNFNKDGYTAGNPEFSLINYTTQAPILEGLDRNFSDRLPASQDSPTIEADNCFVAYSYPSEWSADILQETYVLLNIPLVNSEDASDVLNNYYKIPLRLVTDDKMLERNRIYKVTATVSSEGNTTEDRPEELGNIDYKVAEWEDVEIPVEDNTPSYLELSEYDIVMKDIDSYQITFASSSSISSAEVTGAYFINKNGRRIDIDKSQISAGYGTGLNGSLTISSPVPENKTIRYITLTVTNLQGLSREVTVMQYPLEYITGISGLYSYVESSEEVWPEHDGSLLTRLVYSTDEENNEYDIDVTVPEEIVSGLDGHIGNKVDMKSKFYIENDQGIGRIFRIDYDYGNSSDTELMDWLRDNDASGSNNRMYHVTITSTSDEYTVARPVMIDGKTDPDNINNDDFVSPSFMLASQLGNSSTISWQDAEDQCAEYVERGQNGEFYDDWRLPTAAEIGILIRYQSDQNVNTGDDYGVMDNILNNAEKDQTNPYYWVSRRGYYIHVHNTYNKDEHLLNNDRDCRVRCVRDFHPGDPTE